MKQTIYHQTHDFTSHIVLYISLIYLYTILLNILSAAAASYKYISKYNIDYKQSTTFNILQHCPTIFQPLHKMK